MMGKISLVAHRGQPHTYPENSLLGFKAVLQAGAMYLETDIQISEDGVPLLSHDPNLLASCGKQIIIAENAFDYLSSIPAGYAELFGDQFEHSRIASLTQLVELLRNYPDVVCFIELKECALDHFGKKAVDLVLDCLRDIHSQVVLISYVRDALIHAKQLDQNLKTGWILSKWDEESRQIANNLKPEYLFIDEQLCPQDATVLWPGAWRWVLFTINDPTRLRDILTLGIEIVETDRFSEMLEESDLLARVC